jgi:hypothetical protein
MMDGIVPFIYIILSVGALLSFCRSMYQLYRVKFTQKLNYQIASINGKGNLAFSFVLLVLWGFAKDTIIGDGLLLYIVPLVFLISLASWWLIKQVDKPS